MRQIGDRLITGPEEAARLIARQFPRWRGLPVRPVRPGGWDNTTFRLGERMLIRLPTAERYAAQVEKEHRWLPRLAPALPCPIPAPLAKGRPDAGFPWPWSVYRWQLGLPADQAACRGSEGFARDLAAFLSALHRIGTAGAPPAGAHNFHRGGPLGHYADEAWAALAAMNDTVDPPLARAVLDRALASHWPHAPVWVHGDFAPGNLLTRGARLAAVIDFGTCGIGDPACDLAIAWIGLDGPARRAFRAALPLDAETWARGRGWVLWKSLITLAGTPGPQGTAAARQALAAVLQEHRAGA